MNLKKMGIKVLLFTILLIVITKNVDMDPYLRTALSVFGIGSGLMLMFLDSYRHYGD